MPKAILETSSKLMKLAHKVPGFSNIHGFLPENRYRRLASLVLITTPVLFVAVIVVSFMASSTNKVDFSYNSINCFPQHVLFSSHENFVAGDSFRAVPTGGISIGEFNLYSDTTCLEPVKPSADKIDAVDVKMLGIFERQIQIAHELPVADFTGSSEVEYNNSDSIEFELNKPSIYFTYVLSSGDQSVDCQVEQTIAVCSLAELQLATGMSHPITLSTMSDNNLYVELATATINIEADAEVLAEAPSPPKTAPRVYATSPKQFGANRFAAIEVYFDQPLLPTQDLTPLIGLTANNLPIQFSLTYSGSTAKLSPAQALPACTNVIILVAAGVVSIDGITDTTTSYKETFRTSCAETLSIGTSVQGRAITAYKFGSGAKSILYYGGLHGNEISSKYILQSWIAELEANFGRIPANVTIFIVPAVNPDGVASGTRHNANGVDLNRNFDTPDWKKDVTVPGGALLVNGGGANPMSEPETQAIANFSLGKNLVVYYHAVANSVIANGTQSSFNYASLYSQTSGYPDESHTSSSELFDYDITGTYGDWTANKGVSGVLIELRTMAGNEFNISKEAIWKMAESL